MKILVYGAGVIGSIYAAKLFAAGNNVTLLARGKRYEDLKKNGVIIKEVITGKQIISNLPLTQQLTLSDYYDLIIVTVRLDQIGDALPDLKQNAACTTMMFMLNNPDDKSQLVNEFPQKNILLGFPGVGGTYQENRIDYAQIKQQETTIGNIDGKITNETNEIKQLFENAGFKTEISTNMQAWLKTHAVFVSCVSAAIAKENGDSIQLGKNKSSVRIMAQSIREGFSACKNLGMPIKPTNLKTIFLVMPQWFCVLYWKKAMQGKIGTLSIAPHANAAKGEMQLLAKKVLGIVHSSSVSTPTLDRLLTEFIG